MPPGVLPGQMFDILSGWINNTIVQIRKKEIEKSDVQKNT
jgi:hypothetical protein